MRAALEGMETLYFVSGREDADRLEQHRTVVRAAVAAGIEAIVYVSFLGAGADATFTLARYHGATEEAIRGSGLAFTFLRSSLYVDFGPFLAGPKGVIRGPAGEGRLAPVSRDDLADVATAILAAGGEHDGKTYELTGPELLGVAELAERLSTYTGSAVRYAEETVEEAWESRRPCGAPDREIEGWVSSYLAMADGSLAVKTDAVETSPATPRRRSSSASMPIPNSWAAGNPPRDPAAPARA